MASRPTAQPAKHPRRRRCCRLSGEQKQWTVDDHLRGADPASVDLFRAVEQLIRSFGPVSLSVSKTTITFKGTRRGFAGAKPTKHGVEGYLDLPRSLVGDPRI